MLFYFTIGSNRNGKTQEIKYKLQMKHSNSKLEIELNHILHRALIAEANQITRLENQFLTLFTAS
jgi:hypothetical protein